MRAEIQERYATRVRIFKALAHPSRLFICDELSRGTRCVQELTDLVGADVSTVSKHLSILREAGVVSDRKEGLRVFYELKAPCVLNFLSCIEDMIKRDAEERMASLRN